MASLTQDDIEYMMAHASDNKAPGFLAANVVLCAVATIAVILRAIAKHMTKSGLGWDDGLILLAWVGNVGYSVADSITVRYGMGRHIILVTDPKSLVIAITVSECFFNWTVMFIKLSVLAFYLRIFPQHRFHMVVYLMGTIAILQNVPVIFLTIFQCIPISAQWDPVAKETARCLDYHSVTVVSGALNIITDVIIVAMPAPLVLKLQISSRKKRLIMVAFGAGAVACIVDIVRLAYSSALGSADTTWDYIPALITTAVELCVAIVCACVPLYRPLLSKRMRSDDDSTTRDKTYGKPASLTLKSLGRRGNKGWDTISDQDRLTEADAQTGPSGIRVQRDYTVTVSAQ